LALTQKHSQLIGAARLMGLLLGGNFIMLCDMSMLFDS
jgi:hypothetical protein